MITLRSRPLDSETLSTGRRCERCASRASRGRTFMAAAAPGIMPLGLSRAADGRALWIILTEMGFVSENMASFHRARDGLRESPIVSSDNRSVRCGLGEQAPEQAPSMKLVPVNGASTSPRLTRSQQQARRVTRSASVCIIKVNNQETMSGAEAEVHLALQPRGISEAESQLPRLGKGKIPLYRVKELIFWDLNTP